MCEFDPSSSGKSCNIRLFSKPLTSIDSAQVLCQLFRWSPVNSPGTKPFRNRLSLGSFIAETSSILPCLHKRIFSSPALMLSHLKIRSFSRTEMGSLENVTSRPKCRPILYNCRFNGSVSKRSIADLCRLTQSAPTSQDIRSPFAPDRDFSIDISHNGNTLPEHPQRETQVRNLSVGYLLSHFLPKPQNEVGKVGLTVDMFICNSHDIYDVG